MLLFPRSGFGRFLLALIILSTISYLVLNLVSFGGTPWITYTDAPIRFGLWRVCDTSAEGLCDTWSTDTYSSNITLVTFGSSKPGFIRTSQALEIISLVFYVVAAVLIIAGIANLGGLSFQVLFAIAAVLLFICIAFLSATLGVMSVQGRSGHTGFLDWAWWNGLVGLIMTIITFFALLFLILDLSISPRNEDLLFKQNPGNQSNTWNNVPVGSYGMPMGPPPAFDTIGQMVYPSPTPMHYNQHPYSQGYSAPHHYDYNQYDQQQQYLYQQAQQYADNSMNSYGNQSAAERYYQDQSPSPIISALAQQYVANITDTQYRNQLLSPYGYADQTPYVYNDYL